MAMQMESAGDSGHDIETVETLLDAESHDSEYQSQFLAQGNHEILLRGLLAAIPASLALWGMIGLAIWKLMH